MIYHRINKKTTTHSSVGAMRRRVTLQLENVSAVCLVAMLVIVEEFVFCLW